MPCDEDGERWQLYTRDPLFQQIPICGKGEEDMQFYPKPRPPLPPFPPQYPFPWFPILPPYMKGDLWKYQSSEECEAWILDLRGIRMVEFTFWGMRSEGDRCFEAPE